jgi:hypothetical protein
MPGNDDLGHADMRDDDLRGRFAKLRTEDKARTGEFNALLRRTRPKNNRVRLTAWVVVGLAVILASLVVLDDRETQRKPPNPEVSITAWKSSTDFLLRTPGQEVLTTVPKIGEWPATHDAEPKPQKDTKPLRKNLSKLLNEEHLS